MVLCVSANSLWLYLLAVAFQQFSSVGRLLVRSVGQFVRAQVRPRVASDFKEGLRRIWLERTSVRSAWCVSCVRCVACVQRVRQGTSDLAVVVRLVRARRSRRFSLCSLSFSLHPFLFIGSLSSLPLPFLPSPYPAHTVLSKIRQQRAGAARSCHYCNCLVFVRSSLKIRFSSLSRADRADIGVPLVIVIATVVAAVAIATVVSTGATSSPS